MISRRSESGEGGGSVNALPTGRRRATKEATAHSKATVQPLSHAKHSNELCKGCGGREQPQGLSHEGHLKHTDQNLKRAACCTLVSTYSSGFFEFYYGEKLSGTKMHGLATCRFFSDSHDLYLLPHSYRLFSP